MDCVTHKTAQLYEQRFPVGVLYEDSYLFLTCIAMFTKQIFVTGDNDDDVVDDDDDDW